MTATARIRSEAEALAARLPPLMIAAERVVANMAVGAHGRRRVGSGDAFWQFRPYVPGDSAARIDWRQTAKSTRAYLRETEWEAAQSVWLWHDRSPSMAWASEKSLPTKVDRAALLIQALGTLLVRAGERIAPLKPGVRPGTGTPALERLARAAEDPGESLPPPLALARDSTVVLVSDFLAPLEDWHGMFQRFAAQRVHGHLLELLDPAEEDLPFEGRVRFEGLEREGDLMVGRAEALRTAYRTRLAQHRAGLADLARAHGWSLASHRTDRPPHGALLALHERMADRPMGA